MSLFPTLCRLGFLLCLVISSAVAGAETPPPSGTFATWLKAFRSEALATGIGAETLDLALDGLAPIPRVVALDRRQPEFTQTFAQYIDARLSQSRIAAGQKALADNRAALDAVAAAYHVQPRFIVAIWGMETNYGAFTGSFPVIAALATLAFDGRRSAYFRRELINALKIVDAGHITPAAMKGSWAGAMGQAQFMPSSFLTFARDFDGDGRDDIWGSKADVFASIANYLAKNGWRDDQTWGRRVMLPSGFEEKLPGLAPAKPPRSCRRALKDHSRRLVLDEWQALGLRRLDGRDLPGRALAASFVQPDGPGGMGFLTYGNYRSLLRYNCSNFYAAAVGLLADRIAGR